MAGATSAFSLNHRGPHRMAHEEPLLDNPPTPEAASHVRDYTGFVKLLKWSAILSFVTAILVMMIISN